MLYAAILKGLINDNPRIKNDTFPASAQDTDCGHTPELPQRGSSNEQRYWCTIHAPQQKQETYANPSKSQFYYIQKVGRKRVYST